MYKHVTVLSSMHGALSNIKSSVEILKTRFCDMKDHDWVTYGLNEEGAKLADQWIGKVQEIVDNVDAGVLECLLKEAKWIKSKRLRND